MSVGAFASYVRFLFCGAGTVRAGDVLLFLSLGFYLWGVFLLSAFGTSPESDAALDDGVNVVPSKFCHSANRD